MPVNKDDFKRVMGSFAAGVTVVTTIDKGGKKWGLTATAFSSLSLDPPLCLVCVNRRTGSLGAITESRVFAVNLLGGEQEALSNHFASKLDDKLAGVAHRNGEATGCPLLEGTLASMECRVVDILEGGDHQIVVGQLETATVAEDGSPLVYWRGAYRSIGGGGGADQT